MPNTFTDHRDRWLQMSEVDYVGQFVKAWLAFNAWYRSAYTATRDRDIIEEIKWTNPSPIGSVFRPLLQHTSEEADQFRAEISMLHHRLSRYELHTGKGNEKNRISLSRIVIRTEPPYAENGNFHRWSYAVQRVNNSDMTFDIVKPNGTAHLSLGVHKYDPAVLSGHADFATVPAGVKTRCRSLYEAAAPKLLRDLTTGDADPISCGTYTFRCGVDFLFGGLVEAIYLMRCSLFHGELVPTREATECYEPAYRIVRRFLNSIT